MTTALTNKRWNGKVRLNLDLQMDIDASPSAIGFPIDP
jgi:hypothetical protein